MFDDHLSSVHLRSGHIDEAKKAFERQAIGVEQAYLAPEINGWMALYPRQADTAKKWAETLSRDLKCHAVAFEVIEDQVFAYHLFANGKMLDTYVNRPSYYLGHGDDIPLEKIEAMRGKPEAWEGLAKEGLGPSDIAKVLVSGFEHAKGNASSIEYVKVMQLLEDLAGLLGIVGADSTFSEIEEEIDEWEEDSEDEDEEDDGDGGAYDENDDGATDPDEEENEPMRSLTCGRPPEEVIFVRAPRKKAGTARNS